MEMLIADVGLRLRINSVANRVHKLSLVGKGKPDIASSIELFPED